MSAMGQFKNLWPDDYKGGLPIIFNFVNNHYGMGGQTQGETMSFEALPSRCRDKSGAMHAERVDGFNPLAVIDAMKQLQLLHKGKVLYYLML